MTKISFDYAVVEKEPSIQVFVIVETGRMSEPGT